MFGLDFITNGIGAGLGLLGKKNEGTAFGDILGTLGPGLAQGLGKGIELLSGGGSSSPMDQAADDLARIQQIASYNAAGYEGAAANRSAQMKARELLNTNSAENLLNQATQRSLASQSLQSAQDMTNAATRNTLQQAGAQRNQLFNQAAAQGAGAAALAGIGRRSSEGIGQSLNQLGAQSAQATQSGLGQAGNLTGSAEASRVQDLQSRANIFDRYGLQKFSPTNAGALSGMGSYMESQAGVKAMEDPLALLKATGGQFAGSNMANVDLRQITDFLRGTALSGTSNSPYYGPGY